MFFLASKVLFFLFQPSSLAVLALVAGVGLSATQRFAKGGRRLTIAALLFLLIAGFSPLGNILIYPLETRFGAREPDIPKEPIAGIILLGGFEDGWVSAGRGGLAVNEAAERLTEGLRLARHLPNAKIIFTGGVGVLFAGEDAGLPVRDYLIDAGIAPDRIVIEKTSRNTHENALFVSDLVKPQPGDRWLLVTSAYHMPRSMGVFRKAGFDVLPFPVDFRTRDAGDMLQPFNRLGSGLERTDLAAKEWIGLVAYRLSGRSDALFPAP